VVKFSGEKNDGKARAAQWMVFVGGGLVGLAAIGIFAWKAFAAEPRVEVVPEDSERVRKMMEGKRAASAAAAARLKQQALGESATIDESGRFMGIASDGSPLLKNRSLEQAAGPANQKSGELSAVTREINAQSRVPAVTTEEEEQVHRRPAGASRAERDSGEEPVRRERRGDDGKSTMLGYTINQAATWATRRPGSGGTERGEVGAGGDGREKGDPMAAALDGAVRAQERLLAGTTARAAAASGAAAGLGSGLGLGGPGGPSASGRSLYAEDDDVAGGPATKGPQLFQRGGVGDMRLSSETVPSQIVRQGKFLDCALVNQLRADLVESEVIAMVVRDFVSVDGALVLVPAGTKLVGAAGRVQNVQQARVYIRFERLIYPDQRTVFFPRKVPAVDALGAAGVEGDVDRHFFLQFGSAVMLGVLDGLAAAVQGSAVGASDPSLRDLVVGRTSSNLASVMAGIIGRYGNVVPTITVEPGEKIKVFFADDVELTPYAPTRGVSREDRLRDEEQAGTAEGFVPKGLRR
jgi:type IV secretion system protein VirB10